MQDCADGRWSVIIRGQTIDPLVRGFERLFNTGALDTVRRKKDPNRKKGVGGGSGGRQRQERETDSRGRKQEKFE